MEKKTQTKTQNKCQIKTTGSISTRNCTKQATLLPVESALFIAELYWLMSSF